MREAILDAAVEIFALKGKGGLSVTKVARRAGVDRGTAYRHFRTREELIESLITRSSAELRHAMFGELPIAVDQASRSLDIEWIIRQLTAFAARNPACCRVWVFNVLYLSRLPNDQFWCEFVATLEVVAKTKSGALNLDVEVAAVLVLAGCLIGPMWAQALARAPEERTAMIQRFEREVLRLFLHEQPPLKSERVRE